MVEDTLHSEQIEGRGSSHTALFLHYLEFVCISISNMSNPPKLSRHLFGFGIWTTGTLSLKRVQIMREHRTYMCKQGFNTLKASVVETTLGPQPVWHILHRQAFFPMKSCHRCEGVGSKGIESNIFSDSVALFLRISSWARLYSWMWILRWCWMKKHGLQRKGPPEGEKHWRNNSKIPKLKQEIVKIHFWASFDENHQKWGFDT